MEEGPHEAERRHLTGRGPKPHDETGSASVGKTLKWINSAVATGRDCHCCDYEVR
jgi:hypothetical protein